MAMLSALGFNRAFLLSPVTWMAVVLAGVAVGSAVQADRNYDSTCAAIAPVVVGATGGDEYFVQPLDNQTYSYCKDRIPQRFAGIWPLSDCRPGGWSHFSNGHRASFPQNCRARSGTTQVF